MNFLGHIFLSFDNQPLMLGNFIGDFVRGKAYQNYPTDIREGILLHRQIDQFTDQHPAVRKCVQTLRPQFGKYASIIPDIFFDYFLVRNWTNFSEDNFSEFCTKTYAYLLQNQHFMPPKVQLFLPYMVSQNWLLNYGKIWGVRKSLEGLGKRAKYTQNLPEAVHQLARNEAFYQAQFYKFMPEIITFVLNRT